MAFSEKVLTVGGKTVAVQPTGRIRLGPGSSVQVWNGVQWSGAYDEGELVALGVDMDDLKAAARRAAATDADLAAWLATPYNNGDRQFPRASRAAAEGGDVPRETIASLNQEIARDEAGVLLEAARGLVLRSGRSDVSAQVHGHHVKLTDAAGGVLFDRSVGDPSSFVLGADLWRVLLTTGQAAAEPEQMINILRSAGIEGRTLFALVVNAAGEIIKLRAAASGLP